MGLVIQNDLARAETSLLDTHSYEQVQPADTVSTSLSVADFKRVAINEKNIETGSVGEARLILPIAHHHLISQATSTSISIFQLAEVQPADWTFRILQPLVKKRNCIIDYPGSTFRGHHALIRYQFAARINACDKISSQEVINLSPADLATIRRLQGQFMAELATLQGRDDLENPGVKLEAKQFSTITKLSGERIFAVTGGNLSQKRIVGPTGAKIAKDSNSAFFYRKRLDLSTSFNGKDLLKIRLHTGNAREDDNTTGRLDPTFSSVLDLSTKLSDNSQLKLGRLYYTFTPSENFTVSLGPAISATDYVDRNSYANLSNLDFSTQALVNNYILFPIYDPSAGAAIGWKPKGPFSVRAVYVAANGVSIGFNNQGPVKSLSPSMNLLYSTRSGRRSLFNGPYQGTIELEYSPSKAFALRLQYSSGQVLGGQFNVFGANFELALSQQLAVFGRYGYGSYQGTTFGTINPSYWMAGVTLRDLFQPSAFAGIAASQPFIENTVGNATQTNFEVFYNFPLSDTIRVTPLVQVLLDPVNQSSNGTVVTGTLRTVFSF